MEALTLGVAAMERKVSTIFLLTVTVTVKRRVISVMVLTAQQIHFPLSTLLTGSIQTDAQHSE